MRMALALGLALLLSGCGCGINGQYCVSSYSYVQTAPGAWTATAHYGN
jgi:hypothetical protein